MSCLVLVVLVAALSGASARGEDTDEVKRLKEQKELLETKLKLADLQIEKLKKEIEDLKAQKPGEKEVAKQQLSDLLPEGATLSGTWKTLDGKHFGDATPIIAERDKANIKGSFVILDKQNLNKIEYSVKGTVKEKTLELTSYGGADKLTVKLTMKGEELSGTWNGMHPVGLKLPK
jgi:hypothetical protein